MYNYWPAYAIFPSDHIPMVICPQTVANIGFYFEGGGGGVQNILEKWGYLRVAIKATHLPYGGFGGMFPREFFLKWWNLVRFWRIFG